MYELVIRSKLKLSQLRLTTGKEMYNKLASQKKVCVWKLISHYVQEQTINLIV